MGVCLVSQTTPCRYSQRRDSHVLDLLTDPHHSIFGFLLGVTTAGASLYYYVIDEYKVSNELLMEDIYVRKKRPGLFISDLCSTTTYVSQVCRFQSRSRENSKYAKQSLTMA